MLQKLAAMLLAFAVGLAAMLVLQPAQGVVYYSILLQTKRGCLHIHHYILCISLCAFTLLIACVARGSATPSLLVLVGLLLGASASDGVYNDLTLKRHCLVWNPQRTVERSAVGADDAAR